MIYFVYPICEKSWNAHSMKSFHIIRQNILEYYFLLHVSQYQLLILASIYDNVYLPIYRNYTQKYIYLYINTLVNYVCVCVCVCFVCVSRSSSSYI